MVIVLTNQTKLHQSRVSFVLPCSRLLAHWSPQRRRRVERLFPIRRGPERRRRPEMQERAENLSKNFPDIKFGELNLQMSKCGHLIWKPLSLLAPYSLTWSNFAPRNSTVTLPGAFRPLRISTNRRTIIFRGNFWPADSFFSPPRDATFLIFTSGKELLSTCIQY